MTKPPEQTDDASESMVFRTVVVLIVTPAAMASVVGAVIGYSVNGVPGAIGAGLFLGFAGVFTGTLVYWLVGPIKTPRWPTVVAIAAVVTTMILLFIL